MCAPAWELLAKTATMGLVCALCALMLSIHAQNAGPTPALVHTAAALAETPRAILPRRRGRSPAPEPIPRPLAPSGHQHCSAWRSATALIFSGRPSRRSSAARRAVLPGPLRPSA
jgi:hypothetical protein